jgi:hypothetical protein
MENADEADVCAEVLRVGRYFKNGLSAGREQEIVKQPRILQCQNIELVRNGENDMKVTGGQ